MKARETWKRDIFFVLACVGAAAGLGNIWRFPYMAYENGGAAFLIPYLVCLLFVGLPLMLMEIGAGVWSKGSLPAAAQKTSSRMSFVGWWALINSLVIVFYYAIVLAWFVRYAVYSFSLSWGEAPDEFLFQSVLGISGSPWKLGGLQVGTLGALVAIWATIYWIVSAGITRIAKVLVLTVPVPIILLLIMAVNSAGLEGASDGLSQLFTPRLGDIMSTTVWAAAASQVVLSLGLGMGQIVAYASRKRDAGNVVRAGVSICGLDVAISLLAAVVIFATMGFLALSMGVAFDELALDSLPLALVSYPMALNNLPFPPVIVITFGVAFFATLILLGIDSAFAVIEANLTALEERFGAVSRRKLAGILCGICFFGGILFSFGNGLYWLDIVDHWVAYYAIGAIIVLQCVIFTKKDVFGIIWKPVQQVLPWSARPAQVLLRYVIPVIFVGVFGTHIIKEFFEPYSDYPVSALILGGWSVTLISLFLGIAFCRTRLKSSSDDE